MNELNIRIAKAKNIELEWTKFVVDPNGENHATACSPDYSIPENALKLMDEIWDRYEGSFIKKIPFGRYLVVVPYKRKAGIELPSGSSFAEAICLSWLEIFEKEKK